MRRDFFGLNRDSAFGKFRFRTQSPQYLQKSVHVRDVGHAPQNTRFAGEQRRRQNGQAGIFGAVNAGGSTEGMSAFNQKLWHEEIEGNKEKSTSSISLVESIEEVAAEFQRNTLLI